MMATARTQWFAFEFMSNGGPYISSRRRGQPELSPAAEQIAHGLAEHIDADWIQALIEAGSVVYEDDHRGPFSRLPRFRPITLGCAIYILTCLSRAFSRSDDPIGQWLEELRVLLQRYLEALYRISSTISIGHGNEMLNETDREEVLQANMLAGIACFLQRSYRPYRNDSGANGFAVASRPAVAD